MKKTYIIPETLVVLLNTKTCILIGSDPDDELVPGGTTAGTKEYAGDDNSAGGKNVWDEEW